jgi:polycystin 1L2
MYPSAGYIEELPLTTTAASARIAKLKNDNWVDENTRAVFVEFSTYNANIDHFSVARCVQKFTLAIAL